MRVLVACEFSGIVREAFRKRGHNAWSCDLLPTEQEGPHIQDNVLRHLQDGWDLMIAHPPCQYLSLAGNVWLKQPGRLEKRRQAFEFFMALANAPIPSIALENPKGYPCTAWRKPDQVIQPFQFGHPAHKPTCLWLKNLPLLLCTRIVPVTPKYDGRRNRHWVDVIGGGGESGRRKRSRTFQGIADAMAEQWGREGGRVMIDDDKGSHEHRCPSCERVWEDACAWPDDYERECGCKYENGPDE